MMPPPALPKSAPRAVFLLYAPIKVVYQVAQLLLAMTFAVARPSHILVQVRCGSTRCTLSLGLFGLFLACAYLVVVAVVCAVVVAGGGGGL
jgi:hypothetical protein